MKDSLIVIGVFVTILLFMLTNTFLASIKQPKIVVTTPNVVIQQPTKTPKPVIQYRTITVVPPAPSHNGGLVHKLKHLF